MGEIKNLEDLLQEDKHTKIVEYSSKKLTSPGENYCSLMLALELKLKNYLNKEEILHIVAKLIPDNPWLKAMPMIQFNFKKELNFYAKIIPALNQFLVEQGMENLMDFFPKYFGGRLNLKPESDVVDEDGAIVLENLKISGYVTLDRREGFNKEVAEFILKNLAVFHAVPIAFKLKHPEKFEEKIKPLIQSSKPSEGEKRKEHEKTLMSRFIGIVKENPDTVHLVDRFEKGIKYSRENWQKLNDGPFATIAHNDCWVTNTMLKLDGSGKPVSNKIIDFQLIDYGSLGKDIMFLLFSSVQIPVIEQYYDHFVKIYYDKFIEVLSNLKCDLELFRFKEFQNQLEICAKSEFLHCVFMTKPILASPAGLKDIKDLKEADMFNEPENQQQKEKIQFLVKEFAKRNWI